MKRIILLFVLILSIGTTVFAQTTGSTNKNGAGKIGFQYPPYQIKSTPMVYELIGEDIVTDQIWYVLTLDPDIVQSFNDTLQLRDANGVPLYKFWARLPQIEQGARDIFLREYRDLISDEPAPFQEKSENDLRQGLIDLKKEFADTVADLKSQKKEENFFKFKARSKIQSDIRAAKKKYKSDKANLTTNLSISVTYNDSLMKTLSAYLDLRENDQMGRGCGLLYNALPLRSDQIPANIGQQVAPTATPPKTSKPATTTPATTKPPKTNPNQGKIID